MKENMMPNPEELKKVQDENMSDDQIKKSTERERIEEDGAEATLLRFADELKGDFGLYGKVEEFYKKSLVTLSKYVGELESAGYIVRVTGKPVKTGGIDVYLELDGKALQIFNEFYDSYGPSFSRNDPVIWEKTTPYLTNNPNAIYQRVLFARKYAESLKKEKINK